ncbi:DYW_deaminase domain-containing protein [Psidium guajava]|nr:DYW_deaminase domain-containing protein [Psidium guajava]
MSHHCTTVCCTSNSAHPRCPAAQLSKADHLLAIHVLRASTVRCYPAVPAVSAADGPLFGG